MCAKQTRDLSEAQFRAKAAKYGFKPTGFMGYWTLPAPFDNVSACRFNGGDRRRSQLAYLMTTLSRHEQKLLQSASKAQS